MMFRDGAMKTTPMLFIHESANRVMDRFGEMRILEGGETRTVSYKTPVLM